MKSVKEIQSDPVSLINKGVVIDCDVIEDCKPVSKNSINLAQTPSPPPALQKTSSPEPTLPTLPISTINKSL